MTEQPVAAPNKRASRRKRPKGSTKARCHAGAMGMGPNLAVALLDLSETGVRLLLKADLRKGSELEVTLQSIGSRAVRALAWVVWSVPAVDGNFCVGARFQKALSYSDLTLLTQQ